MESTRKKRRLNTPGYPFLGVMWANRILILVVIDTGLEEKVMKIEKCIIISLI